MKKKMLPDTNQIHIWVVDLSNFAEREDYFYSILNDDEKKRADAFVTKQLKYRYTISQGVLRTLLAKYLLVAPQDISYSFGIHKKPYLEKNPLYFNISHSGDMALIGISFKDEVGVDIERINLQTIKKGLEKSVFSQRELNLYNSIPEEMRGESFFSAWTHKEALMKLTGDGLYKEPKELDVPLRILNEVRAVKYGDQIKYLRSLYVTDEYIGAIASNQSNFNFSINIYI